MADFCHDFEPGGLGCFGHWPISADGENALCGEGCYGDFTEVVRELRSDGVYIVGLCEEHGHAFAARDSAGKTWFVEIDPKDVGVGCERFRPEVLAAALRAKGAPPEVIAWALEEESAP